MIEYAQNPSEVRLVVGSDPSSPRRGFAGGYGRLSSPLAPSGSAPQGTALQALYYDPVQKALQAIPARIGLAHLELGAQQLEARAEGRWSLAKDPFPADGTAIWLRSGSWHAKRHSSDTAFRLKQLSHEMAPSRALSLTRFDPAALERASRSLLPPQSTTGERLLETQLARLAAPMMRLDQLWEPKRCPEILLPWLGWALHVDVWDPGWPVARKREAISQSLPLHRKKGTRAAVSESLTLLGGAHRITEWFEPEANSLWPSDLRQAGSPAPYTFVVESLTENINLVDWKRIIDANKPARCHYRVHQLRTFQVKIPLLIGAVSFQYVSTTINHTFL